MFPAPRGAALEPEAVTIYLSGVHERLMILIRKFLMPDRNERDPQARRWLNSHLVTIEVCLGLRVSIGATCDTPRYPGQHRPLEIESHQQILLDHADDSK